MNSQFSLNIKETGLTLSFKVLLFATLVLCRGLHLNSRGSHQFPQPIWREKLKSIKFWRFTEDDSNVFRNFLISLNWRG